VEEKWQTMTEFYRPKPSDKVARETFFVAVNKACETEHDPWTPEK
jgi:hypothetical protein